MSTLCLSTAISSDNTYAYDISMTSSGAQSIDVAPSSSGSNGTSIASDAISITTTCPAGYNLSMSTSVDDNKLYLGGTSSSSSYFSPANGTTALKDASNTWGYYFNNSSSTAPTSSSVFSAIPALGNTATIKNSSSTSDSFSVYYGVSASSGLAPGNYKMKQDGSNNANGSIVYYLTMDESCSFAGYMQDVTNEDLEELLPNEGDTVSLADKRDDEVYLVGRLADGNVWLLDNLRLGGSSTMSLTPDDTNIISNFTLPASTIIGFDNFGYTQPAVNADYKNTTTTSYGAGSGKIGNYYNFCAVSAGTYCYPSFEATGNAEHDICPAGWRMPTGGAYQGSGVGDGEYFALGTALGLTYVEGGLVNSGFPGTTYQTALSTPLSGWFSSGSANGQGSSGCFWSSTANDVDGMYQLLVASGRANPPDSGNRSSGSSVRCVKKPDPTLYDFVAEQSKGKQSVSDLQATITTENSGVYEYDYSSSVFGPATDASSDYPIYYYRGILDNTTGSYGSNGDNEAYPNTVVLSSAGSKSELTTSNTCWRIVRTTGSGGTKMIYQGKWTGSTCAHATTSAQTTTKTFDTTANSSAKSIVGVGYTYNASYKSTTTSTQAGTLFGKNSSYSGNTTNSTIKSYLEGTGSSNFWDTISSYESKLEPSAGYCNDRSVNSGKTWTTYSDTTSITTPYTSGSSATAFYFGAYQRNRSTYQTPTLGCPRSTVDLYTTSSASNGNKQLGKPVALLTADEASFAGSGSNTASHGSSYNANSYLRSGSNFWLLSPYYRYSNGYANGFYLRSNGYLSGDYVYSTYGVRPVISLTSATTPVSGSGTATDPWIVNP